MKTSFVVALLISALPAAALAAQGGQGPCAEDAAKLCPGVERGGGRMMACLKEHESSLSPACKEHLVQMKQRMKGAQQACHEDVQRFCADVKPGGGRIMECLKQHQADLSPQCQEMVKQGKMRMRGYRGGQ